MVGGVAGDNDSGGGGGLYGTGRKTNGTRTGTDNRHGHRNARGTAIHERRGGRVVDRHVARNAGRRRPAGNRSRPGNRRETPGGNANNQTGNRSALRTRRQSRNDYVFETATENRGESVGATDIAGTGEGGTIAGQHRNGTRRHRAGHDQAAVFAGVGRRSRDRPGNG